MEIAGSAWHRWLAHDGGMKANDAKRLKELEAENARLKKLVANQALDIEMLNEIAKGKFWPRTASAAVVMLRDRFGVSERRACRVLGQHRSTQRLDPPPISGDERLLREFLRAFSTRRPRWGWRRAAKAARKAGWAVNDKRIRRLWRDEGLRVPTKRREQPLRGLGAPVGAMCPIRPNALWVLDFQFDVTVDGRTLKLLNVFDEFTRECLAIEVDRSSDADHAVRVLERLAAERRRAPAFVRFDNGPEFVAHAVADWCRFNNCDSVFIDPGSPWQNGLIESFNGRLREELLNGRQWDSLLEAQVTIEDWRIDYNMNRPHTALGHLAPAECAAAWTTNQPQAA